MVSLASEFPNDNPALHRGVIWVCLEPTGRAQPEGARAIDPAMAEVEPELRCEVEEVEACAPAYGSLAPPEDEEVDAAAVPILVEELEPIEARVEGDVEPTRDLDAPLEMETVESSECAPELAAQERGAPAESDAEMLAVAESLAEAAAVEAPAPAVEVPAPAVSEVVLVGARAESVGAGSEGAPVEADLTPVFEEVVASEPPRDSTELPSAPDDAFTVLVCALADVAIGAGSPHVASLLPGLLFDGRLPELLDGDVADALRAAGIWDGAEVAPSFVAVTLAWRAILRGTSDDFTACGESMLDEWASDLLARMLKAPAKALTLRQELRSRGVAAFGLVEVAA